MDTQNIKALAEILSQNNLTSIEVCEGDSRVTLRRDLHRADVVETSGQDIAVQASAAPSTLHEVKSPLIGVFYAAPTEGAAPYVTIGSTIKKGQVLCILEAMKLMNEVVCDRDGEIAEVCLSSGDVAEYGQVLFRLR